MFVIIVKNTVMKRRGKSLAAMNNKIDLFSDLQCNKHPQLCPTGICAYCLEERLLKLLCSDCGKQRLSLCSCLDISTKQNSSSLFDVGSVGRISILLENEKPNSTTNKQPKSDDEVLLLKRGSNGVAEIKRKRGFWRVGNFFSKKKSSGDQKSDLWVVDYMGVSRSRSLCSFRGSEDLTSFSGARSSVSAARRSGYDSEKRVSLKHGDFSATSVEGTGFIDLKFDFPVETKAEVKKQSVELESDSVFGSKRNDVDGGGGSCRRTSSAGERGIKKSRKSFKSWRWIFN